MWNFCEIRVKIEQAVKKKKEETKNITKEKMKLA